MKKRNYTGAAIILVLLLFVRFNAGAQPTAWGSVFVNGPFKKQWGLHLDAQLRSGEHMNQLKTWLFRPGLHYQLNGRNTFTLGYAYVEGITRSPGIKAFLPEHRIWQQWLYLQPIQRFQLQHRFRLEQRFIGTTRYREGVGVPTASVYATRLRYFNRMLLPWSGKRPFQRGPFAAIQNELFVHVSGKNKLNGNTFDQNRFYLAMGYRPAPEWDIELGYMRRDLRNALNWVDQHTWQVAVYLRP